MVTNHFFRLFHTIVAATLAVWTTTANLEAAEISGICDMGSAEIENVDRLFAKWSEPDSPGAVVAILRNGKIIYSHGYGMASLEESVANTPSTIFHIASVSKQFTAFAIHLLASDGKLSLDDDVREYIPELPDFGTPITIRQLVHHTSGLRDQWSLLGMAGWRMSDEITDEDVLRIIMRQKELNFPPGEEFLYSNSGYSLLAEIVGRVAGISLAQFAKTRMFAPLGMESTHFQTDYGEVVRNRAYSYASEQDGVFKYIALSYSTYGPSSLFTTVSDLALWDENFYSAQVGGETLLAALLEKGTLNNGMQIDYAAGLVIGQHRGARTISHSGGDAAFRANFLQFPDHHFSVIVLGNAGDLNPDEIAKNVADICLEDMLEPSQNALEARPPITRNEVELDLAALEVFTGDYELAPGFISSITLEDGVLYQKLTNEEKFPIFPSSANTFFAKTNELEFVFADADADGRVRSLTVRQGAREYLLKRIESFSLSPEQLSGFAGMYYSAELDVIYTISDRDGKLSARYPRGDVDLKQTGQIIFVGDFPIGTITFSCGPDNACSSFELTNERVRTLSFVKVDLSGVTTEQ